MGEPVTRWRNGRYGRLAQRRIWLSDDGRVESCEADARARVEHLVATGGDGWREIRVTSRSG